MDEEVKKLPPKADGDQDSISMAFGEGSDARIAGRSVRDVPYAVTSELGRYWLRGWWDVEKHWGENLLRSVPSKLPTVQEPN